jgi:hypothetical protein
MVKRKRGVASHFWAHKMHVKMLIWLAQSQCYGIGRKKLIWGCHEYLLKKQLKKLKKNDSETFIWNLIPKATRP